MSEMPRREGGPLSSDPRTGFLGFDSLASLYIGMATKHALHKPSLARKVKLSGEAWHGIPGRLLNIRRRITQATHSVLFAESHPFSGVSPQRML